MTVSEGVEAAPPARPRFGLKFDGWTAFALAIAGLLAIPVLVVFAAVFTPAGEVWRHLADTVLSRYIFNTLVLALGVGIGTLVIGVGTAWLVSMCRFPGRRLFEWALFLPMAVPAYVLAYSYTGMFEFAGPVQSLLREIFGWARNDYWFPEIRSLGGAIAMLTLVFYPYVYLLSRAAFLEQSICVLEVSRTLGCSATRGFFRVALPLARPAIVGGLALALMETLGDFGTVDYFAVDTFTTGIFRTWFGLGDPGAAAQLAAILTGFVFILIVVERLSRRGARYHHTSSRYRSLPNYRLTGGRAGWAFIACALPVFLGFVLPGFQLVVWAIQTMDQILTPDFGRLALHTVALGAGTAFISVLVALILAYGMRLNRNSRVMPGAARVAGMGYAVPGTVVAVGVLIPFAWFDNTIDAWMRASFGVSTGLFLSGTLAAVCFAYIVRFLAVSLNTVEASLAKITGSMDDAARSLGQTAFGALRRVHLPLMSGSLLTAALLVFVDVMKELPATLILRPFNFNTLAVRAYELASDEQLAEAAGPALAILAAGIIPVVLLSRAIARARPGRSDPHGGDAK
ncbi:MAG: ABC transporter permease [Sphingomonadales bacterium]